MVNEQTEIIDSTPADTGTPEPVAETTEQPVAEEATQYTEQQVQAEPQPDTGVGSILPDPQPQQDQRMGYMENQMNELKSTITRQQEQLQYFNEIEAQNKAQQQAMDYQRKLEEQGWMPEQAQSAAQTYSEQVTQQEKASSDAKAQQEYREGQRRASLYYAKKFNLGLDDIGSLESHNTPESMENEARRIKELRDTKAELDKFKKAQVPPQQFDTNQPAASASGSEEELLDKYNSGVRNPQTEAAARRAAGLG